jgi:hypothetical protein
MKSISNAFRLILTAAFCFVLAPVVLAQEQTPATTPATTPDEQDVQVILGGQVVNSIDERGEARFEELRDVPEGAVLDFARVGFGDASFTAIDAGQDDQRYFLNFWLPNKLKLNAAYSEMQRTYSTGSKTLFSGIGTGNLTIPESFRQGAEDSAGAPNAPLASPALQAYIEHALANANIFDLRTERKNLGAELDYTLLPGLTLTVSGRNEKREGTRPFGFGTYIRRQALAGIPGTGAGNFWRETVEARGVELIEPLDYSTTEFGATVAFVKNGNSVSAGVFQSEFHNDITALYFDNPFEASPGRASATIFDPNSDQEPAAPNGNNNLRGLVARSSMQLAPNNDHQRAFGTVSLRLPFSTRVNATIARGILKQNDRFLPYAENPFVVFSGAAGQPGVVYAKDAPLPRESLNGRMTTTQADLRLTTRVNKVLSLRGGFRYYVLDDERPQIFFPGYSSSGDAYFRRSIGQRDATGARALFNNIGGYARQRTNLGAAFRVGRITLDGEAARTMMKYEERQVDRTNDDSVRFTVRTPVGPGNLNAFYLRASRSYEGLYRVGLETSGVRAFDVWDRDRDQFGVDFELPVGENITAGFGANRWKDEYPGAVTGFFYGYGLQDSSNTSVYALVNYAVGAMTFGATAGIDRYDINSLQVTKTSQTTDYNPINRWTRESDDRNFWIGLTALIPVAKAGKWETAVDYQRFNGTWDTANLATPDVNSAVAYDFPELSDRTISVRSSLLWDFTQHIAFEVRYVYEPYRLDDFTTDIMQPYMQGVFQETHSSPTDVGPMNVSRFLFLDSRTTGYDAHVASALVHLTF